MQRFKEIDGLRAIAVLGVLWAHCWLFFGNLSFNIFGIPINRILSFGGSGVDLFFVISGFCMFYSFNKKYSQLNVYLYFDFLRKRWLRIAPVFYLAVFVYSVVSIFSGIDFSLKTCLLHFLFIQTLFDQNHIAAHFWSLATEWHFYLILPFFYLLTKKIGFYISIYFLIGTCVILRFIHWGYSLESVLSIENYDRIYFRIAEFAWGILVCKLYLENKKIPGILLGNKGVFISISIAYLGRLMNVSELITQFGSYGFILRSISEPVMSFGFGLTLLNLIKSNTFLNSILNSPLFQKIGRVSYSFYIWHWIIASNVCLTLMKTFPTNNFNLTIAFLISAIITYFISLISYEIIEKKYFENQKGKRRHFRVGLKSENLPVKTEVLSQ